MAITQLSDIVDPVVYFDYMRENTVEKSRLFTSGLVQTNAQMESAAEAAGTTGNLPFFNDLDGDDVITPDGASPETPAKVTTGQQTYHKNFRQKAFSVSDLSNVVAGSDPVGDFSARSLSYWDRRFQSVLISMLGGIFDDGDSPLRDGGSADHVNDIAVDSIASQTAATRISVEALVDAVTLKIGDEWDKMRAIAMHSAVFGRLQKDGQINFRRFEEQDLEIPTFGGLNVIVDDGCPTAAGATDGTKYTSYIFGEGAFWWGEGTPKVPIEFEREALSAGETVVTRRDFILHPYGFRYTGSPAAASPTNTEWADGTDWSLVVEHKKVNICKLVTN